MNKSKRGNIINKITKGGDNFILSKWSLIVFMSMITVAAIVNYILFGMNLISVKSPFLSPYIDEGKIFADGTFWYLGWVSMTLSLTGSLFNIWGFILITRMDKRFIIPILLGGVLSIPNEIFVGAIFSGVCFSFLVLVEVWTWWKWKHDDGVSNSKATKKHYIGLAIVWIVFVIIGFSVILSVDWFTTDSYFVPIVDVLGSSIILVCWSLTLLKNRWALLILVFNDSLYIFLYIFQGVFSMAITFLAYVLMNFMGFLGWSSKEKTVKEKNKKTIEIPKNEEHLLIFRNQ